MKAGFTREPHTVVAKQPAPISSKVNTETQYRGDVPIDDNGDGEPDRTEEKIFSESAGTGYRSSGRCA